MIQASGFQWPYSHGHNILRPQVISPQVKRSVIISNKHGIYELRHELPNDLRLTKLGKITKISKLDRIITQRPILPPNQKLPRH